MLKTMKTKISGQPLRSALRERQRISKAIKERNETSPSSQAGNGSKDPDDWPEK